MAPKQNFFFLFTLLLLSISFSNARDTKSFGKLTRREAVVSEIYLAPAPATAVDDTSAALSPTEYDGYGLYSSDQTPRYDDEQSLQTDNNNDQYFDQTNSYNYNDDKQQQQGLSDTRFLDNGMYYHDVTTENDNSYYDNDDLGETQRHEFDSMEEYQKYQEAHPYLP